MVEKYVGIVLRTIKYNDNLMIADMYTQGHGRASYLVSMSHSKRSKVRSVLFRPLAVLSFCAPPHKSKSLVRISEVQPMSLYSSIPYDMAKSAIALYIAEFLCGALHEEEPNEELFAYLCHSLEWFDTATTGYSDFHIIFLWRMTRFLGIYPNVEDFLPECHFDLAAGSLVDERPTHGQFLSPEATRVFVRLLATDFNAAQSLSLNRAARWEHIALLQNYYRLHIPGFPELKSSQVLKELFD